MYRFAFSFIVVVQKRSVILTFFLQPLMPQFFISEHNYEKRYKFCLKRNDILPIAIYFVTPNS